MDLNKLTFLKDISKSKLDVGKCEGLNIGSKKIKIEYKLNNKEISIVNEDCDQRLTLMVHLHFSIVFVSIISRINGMIDWMVIKFISRKANVYRKG